MAETTGATKLAKKPRPCRQTIGPDEYDPSIYLCNRKVPHKHLHADIDADGDVIATWCTCNDCKQPNDDLTQGE